MMDVIQEEDASSTDEDVSSEEESEESADEETKAKDGVKTKVEKTKKVNILDMNRSYID